LVDKNEERGKLHGNIIFFFIFYQFFFKARREEKALERFKNLLEKGAQSSSDDETA
jgi:hypothetical protein